VTRSVVEVVQNQAKRLAGDSGSLTRSQLVSDHAWIDRFVANLGPLIEDRISLDLPQHFVEQVFRLFDADENGTISKQEWVTKCNVLTTEGRDQRIAALFTLVDEDGDGLVTEEEVQRVIGSVVQLVHEATPQVATQVTEVLVDRMAHLVYQELQVPYGRIIPAERMHGFLLGLRKSLPHDWLANGLDGLLRESEVNSADLFRRYATVVQVGGDSVRGITPDMFNKLLEDVLNLDAIFSRFDAMLPVGGDDKEIQAELSVLRKALQDRVRGDNFSISGLLFRALDLDNSGVVDETELQGFVDLLHHTSVYAGSVKANELSQSTTAAAMAMFNSTYETEVQYVMHVLAKNKRVTLERLLGFLNAWAGLFKTLFLEYVEGHTNKEVRETHLRTIVRSWFKQISKGKDSMNVRAFATVLGNVVSALD
jgi:Ca2+-binding EF-hand superfamily protein